jgi:hypothetical protein
VALQEQRRPCTCDDDEVERTGSGGGEGTTSAGGASVVIEGDEENNGRTVGESTMRTLVSRDWTSSTPPPSTKQGTPLALPPLK